MQNAAPPAVWLHSERAARRRKSIALSSNMFSFKQLMIFLTIAASISDLAGGISASQKLYECKPNGCTLTSRKQKPAAWPLEVCRSFCGDFGVLWPLPTGRVKIGKETVPLSGMVSWTRGEEMDTFVFDASKDPSTLVDKTIEYAVRNLEREIQPTRKNEDTLCESCDLVVHFHVSSDEQLSVDTDESYVLRIKRVFKEAQATKFSTGDAPQSCTVEVSVRAKTRYGARHAITTLSQLVSYDAVAEEHRIVSSVFAEDAPKHKHRGLLIDTGRNFLQVQTIKRTIEAMSMTKMNRLHWHLTDSQSFPLSLPSRPEMAEQGAYSREEVYTLQDVREIIRHGERHGVLVIPELDTPSHAYKGWSSEKGIVVCGDSQPWTEFCLEPPCGQLNVSNPRVYEVLGQVYSDMMDIFCESSLFHMGGDEVIGRCWQEDQATKALAESLDGIAGDANSTLALWAYFQRSAFDALQKAAKLKSCAKKTAVLWDSDLIYNKAARKKAGISADDYAIQLWLEEDPATLIAEGFKVILSSVNSWYLDCGFGNWMTGNSSWCGEVKTWANLYQNKLRWHTNDREQSRILGAEACLWGEQTDDSNIDVKLWPRTAAAAERLWSDPQSDWTLASARLYAFRERLRKHGIAAEVLQPQYCYDSYPEGYCHL